MTDVVIIGAGHNGLVAACYLAQAGMRVRILEAADEVGGAALSAQAFPGVDARLSKYSYLISLLPDKIQGDLGVRIPTVRRDVSSYTPDPADPSRGLAVPIGDPAWFTEQVTRLTGSSADADAWVNFYARIAAFAGPLFDSLTEPLQSGEAIRTMVGDAAWHDFFERPLGEVIESTISSDLMRGVVFTDALIGTFAAAHDPSLHQNLCFLYHVIGRGTGDWDVPIGGMGAFTQALAQRARDLGVRIDTGAPVRAVDSGIVQTDDERIETTWVLANCAPALLDELRGRTPAPIDALNGGAQVKVNMVLKRLPRLAESGIDPRHAFNGTFHVNENYSQIASAYAQASSGVLPHPLPLEIYCHSLTDPSILGPELQASGAQTMTVFALHTPHELFTLNNDSMRSQARDAVLASLNSVLAEPIEDCLLIDGNGQPCIETNTTVDVQDSLRIPTGNIFHTPLDRPYALTDAEVGSWGVETDDPSIVLCGAGARRGGGVSGIPGHNAAKHVLAATKTS
jgi:phytoene dehydrogenase-like protein